MPLFELLNPEASKTMTKSLQKTFKEIDVSEKTMKIIKKLQSSQSKNKVRT